VTASISRGHLILGEHPRQISWIVCAAPLAGGVGVVGDDPRDGRFN
jgi:hypothetical protein